MKKSTGELAKKATGKLAHVKVKVVFKKGVCTAGHEVGDEWIIGRLTPGGMCAMAYHAIYPNIRILQRGGRYEYPAGSGLIRSACTDAWNQVVFELIPVPGTGAEPSPLPATCGYLEYLK